MIPLPWPVLREALDGVGRSVESYNHLVHSAIHWEWALKKSKNRGKQFWNLSTQQSYYPYQLSHRLHFHPSHLATIHLHSLLQRLDFPHCPSYVLVKSVMERNFNTSLFTNIQCKNVVKCCVRNISQSLCDFSTGICVSGTATNVNFKWMQHSLSLEERSWWADHAHGVSCFTVFNVSSLRSDRGTRKNILGAE